MSTMPGREPHDFGGINAAYWWYLAYFLWQFSPFLLPQLRSGPSRCLADPCREHFDQANPPLLLVAQRRWSRKTQVEGVQTENQLVHQLRAESVLVPAQSTGVWNQLTDIVRGGVEGHIEAR